MLTNVLVIPVALAEARAHARVWVELAAASVLIGAHGLQIAATALGAGIAVATLNVTEFRRVSGQPLAELTPFVPTRRLRIVHDTGGKSGPLRRRSTSGTGVHSAGSFSSPSLRALPAGPCQGAESVKHRKRARILFHVSLQCSRSPHSLKHRKCRARGRARHVVRWKHEQRTAGVRDCESTKLILTGYRQRSSGMTQAPDASFTAAMG